MTDPEVPRAAPEVAPAAAPISPETGATDGPAPAPQAPTADLRRRAIDAATALWALGSYRGPTADGVALSTWLLVLLFAWTASWALFGFELFWTMIPPMLTLAVAIPLVQGAQAAAARAARRRGASAWLEALVAMGVCGVYTWSVLGYVVTQRIPIDSYDHHMMIARAKLLTEALAHGRLQHFSHLFQGGDSLVDLYPIFINLVTAGFHFLAPRGTPFVTTYSAVCLGAFWLRGVAVYNLGRRFAGPLAASAVALGSLLEVGSEVWDGVWNGALAWGMIHNNIALTIGLFAFALQIDVCRRITTARLVACALVVATTAFAHPLGLLFIVVATASIGVAALLRAPRAIRPLWALAASACGLLMAAIWVLPYTNALRLYGFNGANPGVDYDDIGKGFFSGHVPNTSFAAFIGFGLIAAFACLTRKDVPSLAAGIVATLFFLLALSPFMIQARIFTYFPSFLDAQQRRALTVLKTAIVPALAWLLGAAFAHLGRHSLSARAVAARALVLGLLLYGPGRALAHGLGSITADLRAQVPMESSGVRSDHSNTSPEHMAAFAWLKARRDEDPIGTPWRLCLLDRFNPTSHPHWVWAEGEETGVPVVDFGWVSANFLGNRPREFSGAGLRDWNVRYAIGVEAKAPFANMVPRFVSGPYHIWEFTDYDDRFVVAPPGVQIRDLSLRGDDVSFRVEGAPPQGVDVVVRAAYLPRWRAAQNGRSVGVSPISPHAGAKPRQDQLALHVANGPVSVSCDGTMPRFWPGLLLSLVGALSLAALASTRRRARLTTRLSAMFERLRERGRGYSGRTAAWFAPRSRRLGAMAAAALCLLLVSRRGSSNLLLPPIEGVGMTVRAFLPDGGKVPCESHFWEGRYLCKDPGPRGGQLVVRAMEGMTPILDDSGEYAHLWPATHIQLADAKSRVDLVFSRVATSRRAFEFEADTSGRVSIRLVVGGQEGPAEIFEGQGIKKTLLVPPGARSPAELTVKIEALGAGAAVMFRARAVP